jgi:hypothetical protein
MLKAQLVWQDMNPEMHENDRPSYKQACVIEIDTTQDVNWVTALQH